MKRILTATICLVLALTGHSQGNEQHISHKQFQSVIPQSPNAASLGKYGEVPVGTYTGIPSITVPLYEINTGKLKLPVTLGYHAGGIKVEEIASWSGLGWSVSPGGQVTRQVRGVPDESAHGYLAEFRGIYAYEQLDAYQKRDYLRNVLHYEFDSEPDIFLFSAGSLSGEFFFDTTGAIISNPLSKIGISGLNGFTITDNEGTVFYFNTPETTSSSTLSNNSLGGYNSAVSAWLLSKIVSATGNDSINFEYEPNVTNFTSFSSQTKYYSYQSNGPDCTKNPVTYTSYNSVLGYRLKKILFKNGEVVFNKKSDMRLDVPDDNALESVVIHSDNDRFYKKYTFYQHYAVSNGAPSPASKEDYRLILDSISVTDNGAEALQKYRFEYDSPEQLPNRMSFSRDYWGYFNNANNGNDLVPSAFLEFALWSSPAYVPGANRNPNEAYARKGALTKITYPTGGNTSFTYEGNRALTTKQIAGTPETNGSISVGSAINGGTVFTSSAFTIPNCGYNSNYVSVSVILNNSNCGNGTQSLDCPLVNIINQNTGSIIPITASGNILLPVNQTWYVQADLSGVTDQNVFNNFYVTLNWINCSPIQMPGVNTMFNSPAGGLRIKTITNFDPVGSVSETKMYDYNLPGTNYSSGYLTCFPEFVGEYWQVNGPNGSPCLFKTISSVSNYPLLSTRGSTVGYSFVREIFGSNGQNGIKEYRYISPGDVPDAVEMNYPFPPSLSNEWQRGYPLYERTLKAQTVNGQTVYTPVARKIYKYTYPLPLVSRHGLKAGIQWHDNSAEGSNEVGTALIYNVQGGLFVPSGDTTITYSTSGSTDSLLSTSSLTYSLNSFLPNETTAGVSGGKIVTTKIIYASDYSAMPSSTDPVTMGIRNSTTATTPIETYMVAKNASGQEFVTSGMLTTWLPDKPLPDKIYALKLADPLPLASFTASYINSSGVFIKDSHYAEEVLFNGYDAHANLKGQQKKDNIPLSYIYDYKNSLPVAQAVNAVQDDIAYTSFEADGKGGWLFSGTPVADNTAPTGTKTYSPASGLISRSISASKTYIVSFWKKGYVSISAGTPYRTGRTINGWTYVEYEISGSTRFEINGGGSIDELRLYPKKAQMTSYTFEPLLGITSQSDVNGNISYYEYDSLGRLKLVRDTDKNIIKAMDYQYQKPVTQ